MNLIKYIFFFFHFLGIISVCFLWIFNYHEILLLIQITTITSWKLNNNVCLLTQIEQYLFDSTLIDFIYQKKSTGDKKVPRWNRYLVYLLTIVNYIYTLGNL